MPDTAVMTQELSLPEELVLMLLNDQTGYFHQVPGWNLNCAVMGAVLAELSFRLRIDSDLDSLILVDAAETGDPLLDSVLKEIAAEPEPRGVQFWVERFATRAERVIDRILDRLVEIGIVKHEFGDFWTLTAGFSAGSSSQEYIKARVARAIFHGELPDPRDIVIIALIDTCGVFRFIFDLDEKTEERIAEIRRMDLISHSIAAAVEDNVINSLFVRTPLSRQIPRVPLRRLLFDPNLRKGLISLVFADLAKEYGPVFEVRPPVGKPMIFLAGPSTNRWAHRNGRKYLKTRPYLAGIEKTYGAMGVLPALDGSDHFRLRKAYAPTCSEAWLAGNLDQLFKLTRKVMANWTVGETYQARSMCRRMINGQVSYLQAGVDSQDLIDDLICFKERALAVHVVEALPEFTLKTPGMRRREKLIEEFFERVRNHQTSHQRAGCPQNLVGDLLSLHASDPQLMPETNLRFALTVTAQLAMYFGDTLSFAIYDMVTRPELHDKIRSEADSLFDNGDPAIDDLSPSAIDVTRRLIQESLRMHPTLAMSLRDVVNACVVEGYELPVGSRVCIAQSATHYMDDEFPDPFSFDIDRYLPPRNEHLSLGYAPYGLGTHSCLGMRYAALQTAVNLLMIAHYFDVSVSPSNYVLRCSVVPTVKPTRKLKFHIAGQRRELPA